MIDRILREFKMKNLYNCKNKSNNFVEERRI